MPKWTAKGMKLLRSAGRKNRDFWRAPFATHFGYRAAPVFGVPPCPVEVGADCVVLGPVAVNDVL
jgi:hypothetical protein